MEFSEAAGLNVDDRAQFRGLALRTKDAPMLSMNRTAAPWPESSGTTM
jgi:hypothetical protein